MIAGADGQPEVTVRRDGWACNLSTWDWTDGSHVSCRVQAPNGASLEIDRCSFSPTEEDAEFMIMSAMLLMEGGGVR